MPLPRPTPRGAARRAVLALALALAVAIGGGSGGALAAPREGAAPDAAATSSSVVTKRLAFDKPFTGISVCTPIALLVTEAASGSEDAYTALLSGPANAVEAFALTRTVPGSGSVLVESARPFDAGPATPLRLEFRVPPGTLQYVERVHAPGDTWVDVEMSAEKAEVAIAASSGALLAEKMGTGMAKLSLAGPGPAVLAGSGPWWELFVTGGGVAHGRGATGSVRVKVGEGGRLTLAPAADNVTVDGWVGAGGASLSMTQGVCYVKDETDGAEHEGKLYPCSGGGGGGSASSPPAVVPQWTCGVSTATPWRCGGGGAGGAAFPAFTPGPCSAGKVETAMAPMKE